jgi:hypothetical protein
MSARETILAAVATALASVASGRVYRSRQEQLPTLPAVVITPDREEAGEFALGAMDRRLTVAIAVLAQGDTPDSAADSVLSAAWAALYATPDLGQGSNVQLQPLHDVAWDFDDFDYARATLRVTYTYRTASGSM